MEGTPVSETNTKWKDLENYILTNKPNFICLQSCKNVPYKLYQNDLPITQDTEITCGYYNYGNHSMSIEYYVVHYNDETNSLAIMTKIAQSNKEEENKRVYRLIRSSTSTNVAIGVQQEDITCYSVNSNNLNIDAQKDEIHNLIEKAKSTNLGGFILGGSFSCTPEELGEKILTSTIKVQAPQTPTFRLQKSDYFISNVSAQKTEVINETLISDHKAIQITIK